MEVGILLSAASSLTSYMGSRAEADMHERNAQASLDAAEYNATVTRQNYQQQAQDTAFKKSQAVYNRSKLVDDYAKKIRDSKTKFAYEKSKVATIGYGGTSSAIIDAMEMQQFNQEQDMLAARSDETLSSQLQIQEFTRLGKLQADTGAAEARNILHEGKISYNQNMFKASQTRSAATAELLGSFGSMLISANQPGAPN